MARPKHKTTLSILRSILGARDGSESAFAEKIGRSPSWMKKASCGKLPLTIEVAKAIAYETGISPDWLMANDPSVPPVDRRGEPYTQETYATHRQEDTDKIDFEDWGNSEKDFCKCIEDTIAVMTSASLKNRGGFFVFLLKEFLEGTKKRFGTVEIKGWSRATEYALEVARGISGLENGITPEKFREVCKAQAASANAARPIEWEEIRGEGQAQSGGESASGKSAAKGARIA